VKGITTKRRRFTVKRSLILLVTGVAALAVGLAVAFGATGTGGSTLSVKRLGSAGKVLVDSKGRALYRNDQERGGKVLCVKGCLAFWKPLLVKGAPKAASLPGKLTTVKRPDGGRQVAYNGKLLYTFTLDKPGKVTGDNFADQFGGQKFKWHAARPTGVGAPTTTTGMTTLNYPGY
jgi:predicted lipoprotein with Yx(FWY)xxD motif